MRHEEASSSTIDHLKQEAASWRRVETRSSNAASAMRQRGDLGWQFDGLVETRKEAEQNARVLEAAITLLETK